MAGEGMKAFTARVFRAIADHLDPKPTPKETKPGICLKPGDLQPYLRIGPDPIASLPLATGDTGWRGGYWSTGGTYL